MMLFYNSALGVNFNNLSREPHSNSESSRIFLANAVALRNKLFSIVALIHLAFTDEFTGRVAKHRQFVLLHRQIIILDLERITAKK